MHITFNQKIANLIILVTIQLGGVVKSLLVTIQLKDSAI